MRIESDNQTLNDLSIIENTYGSKSLLCLFNKTSSDGGKKLLKEWMSSPLNQLSEIEERIEAFKANNVPQMRIDREELDFIEYYLNFNDKPTTFSGFNSIFSSINRLFKNDKDRYIVERGITILRNLIKDLADFAKEVTTAYPQLYQNMAHEISDIMKSTELNKDAKGFKAYRIDFYDYVFRYKRPETIKRLLGMVYKMDVIYTVSKLAKDKSYCFPTFTNNRIIRLADFYHPYLIKPVKNHWKMENRNVCIFTGSNMAGKSTTLKTIALCVWLAHCGFPIPATSMACPLFDGIFTSINLPDSLLEGRSHFYAEVIRVKQILQHIYNGKNCFVLFDELFRGTNARDAFDASMSVVECLKEHKDSFFLISTHIIEMAKGYENDKNCCFNYLDSEIKDDKFLCYYKLKNGISESRVGYWIVKKEILDHQAKLKKECDSHNLVVD